MGRISRAGATWLRALHWLGVTVVVLLLSDCALPPAPPKPKTLATQPIRSGYKRLNTLIVPGPLPVVVFEAGLGDTLRTWGAVEPRIAGRALTFSYDRGGLGGSDPAAPPRDGRSIASELHTALTNAHLPPPYILVAHSAGAFYSRIFAGQYPTEVAGMVLVEPACEGFFDALKAQFPADYRTFAARRDNPQAPPAVHHEAEAWDLTEDEARISVLPKIPLTVITARRSWPDHWDLWWEAHENLALESPRPRHLLAKVSAHYAQLTEPELVAQSILQMLSDYRSRPETNAVPRRR